MGCRRSGEVEPRPGIGRPPDVGRTFYRAASWLTGYDLQDASDFKLIDRRVLNEWRRLGERATFFRGLVAWLGFTRTQIAFEVPPRQAGDSRWSFSALGGLAVHAVTSFSALPLQLVTVLGLLMLLVAVVVGAQAVRLWLEGLALPGFTTVILLQLIIGGFLMISLGIIGTYIARIYEEVKGRPRYVVREKTRRRDRAGRGERRGARGVGSATPSRFAATIRRAPWSRSGRRSVSGTARRSG